MNRHNLLMQYHSALRDKLGSGTWWPADTPFEIAIGAILTQNTNWKNVEKALSNLRKKDLLSHTALKKIHISELEELVRPSGFFRMKAARIQNFLRFMDEFQITDLIELKNIDIKELRNSLLKVKGIGPETADSILLYALKMPMFVVDSYTKRIFHRHGFIPEDIDYFELQDFFMDVIPADWQFFSEYHSLIVQAAKKWCTKNNPNCTDCPLGPFLDN